VFLIVAGLVRNRLNVALGQVELPSRQHLRDLAIAVGPRLEAAADELAGRAAPPPPDLRALLDAAEAALALDEATSSEAPGALAAVADLRTQLELYRSLTPMLERLGTLARDAGAQHDRRTRP